MDSFSGYCTIFTSQGFRQTRVQEEASPFEKAKHGRGKARGSRKVSQVFEGEILIIPLALRVGLALKRSQQMHLLNLRHGVSSLS